MPLDAIDFREDVAVAVSDLTEVAALATLATSLKRDVAEREESLKALKQRLRELVENSIPDAMATVGFSEIRLEDGRKITVKDEVSAELSRARAPLACAWLEEHGHGGLIKRDCVVKLPRDFDPTELTQHLDSLGLAYDSEPTVHPQTLKAFLREQLASGETIPLPLFGAFQYRTTIIK